MRTKTEINDVCEEFEEEIGPDTTFVFPQNILEHNVLEKHLVIAPEYANWLVCDEEEYRVFCILRAGKNLQEAWKDLCGQGINADKATKIISLVAAQILGKEFEQKAVVTEKKILKVATLFITAGCNLRCSTCVFSATVAGPNECLLTDWKRFFRAFIKIDGKTITLTGGEPMTSPIFDEIVVSAKGFGLQVVVLTNATLIADENAELLGSKCDEVQVSIDGPNAKTHDSVRGKGTFKKALAGLKKLSTYPSCRLSIAMTPTPATLPVFQTELHRFAKWVRKSIREDISIRVSRVLGKGRRIPSLSTLDQDTYKRAVIALCDDQLEEGSTDKLDTAVIAPNRRKVGCGIGDFLTITADGDIKLCDFFLDSFGNIKNLKEDGNLLNTVAERVKNIAHSLGVEKLLPCHQCDIRYFCGGKCRKDNRRDCNNPNVCECTNEYKKSWYERLVRISPYLVQPLE